jgi:uncharacterized protein involved in exopolysaccharide biosynthesis
MTQITEFATSKMNEKMITQEERTESAGISLLDLFIVVAKRKKLILGLPAAVAVIVAAVSFVLPETYRASTKLLPPQQNQSGAAALLSQLGGLGGVAASAAGLKNPNDLYVGMLKSRTVADQIIRRFNLNRVYGTPSMEMVRDRLASNTFVSAEKDGLITITCQDQDKKLVAPLANAYVDELLKLTKVLAVTEAAQRRLFFERELEQAKNKLVTSEADLKGALETNGVSNVDTESAAVLATVAQLRARISAKEIELRSMGAFVTPTNPDYRLVEQELASLRAEMSKLQNGTGDGKSDAQPAAKTAGLDNVQRLRDVKYYQMLYALLAKQYEGARLEEARDSSVVQVLDTAIEPERRYAPKRTLLVLLAAFAAFVAAVLWAFILEAKAIAMTQPRTLARWNELRSYLKFRTK